MNIQTCRRISEIDADLWDSLNGAENIFHSHRFLSVVEAARVEDSDFWYLLFFNGKRLEATAVLTAFRVSLDLFAGAAINRLSQVVRRQFSNFLRIKVLFCGIPVSLGQSNLVIRQAANAPVILAGTAEVMTDICRRNNIRYCCFKEFRDTGKWSFDNLTNRGYFRAESIPYMYIDLPWKNFANYLSAMRHPYRRAIRKSLKKIGREHPLPSISDNRTTGLVLLSPRDCRPDHFYALYLAVMARATVKLELLNADFFRQLFQQYAGDMELLAFMDNGAISGAALLFCQRKRMTFALVGLDYDRRDQHDIYFNLLNGIIAHAINSGCRRLDLGQTSYWLKQRLGATAEPTCFYLKAENSLINQLLKSLGGVLFPKLELANPRVFKITPENNRQ